MAERSGKVTFISVRLEESEFGPPSDHIVAQAIVFLDHKEEGFGFQLLEGKNSLVHIAMLDTLREAFFRKQPVVLTVDIGSGKKNGIIRDVQLHTDP